MLKGLLATGFFATAYYLYNASQTTYHVMKKTKDTKGNSHWEYYWPWCQFGDWCFSERTSRMMLEESTKTDPGTYKIISLDWRKRGLNEGVKQIYSNEKH
jgi:hypothetical protein